MSTNYIHYIVMDYNWICQNFLNNYYKPYYNIYDINYSEVLNYKNVLNYNSYKKDFYNSYFYHSYIDIFFDNLNNHSIIKPNKFMNNYINTFIKNQYLYDHIEYTWCNMDINQIYMLCHEILYKGGSNHEKRIMYGIMLNYINICIYEFDREGKHHLDVINKFLKILKDLEDEGNNS